jgi:hypothetical protein
MFPQHKTVGGFYLVCADQIRSNDGKVVLMSTLISLSLSFDSTSATFFPRPLSIERSVNEIGCLVLGAAHQWLTIILL